MGIYTVPPFPVLSLSHASGVSVPHRSFPDCPRRMRGDSGAMRRAFPADQPRKGPPAGMCWHMSFPLQVFYKLLMRIFFAAKSQLCLKT